jgi:hypothetical protein
LHVLIFKVPGALKISGMFLSKLQPLTSAGAHLSPAARVDRRIDELGASISL